MSTVQEYRNPILIAVVGVVVAIILYAAFYSPQSSKLSTLQAQETTLQAQQAQLQSQLTVLQTEKQKLPANCADLEKISNQIPSVQSSSDLAAEQSSFYDQLTTLVGTSGTSIPTFSWGSAGSASTGTGVTPVPVGMTISGNFGQMSAFVAGLDSFPRLFTIQTFTLSLGGASSTTSNTAASSSAAPSGSALWVGGTPTAASAGPYTLSIAGSIYYTSTANATAACTKATTIK
jgi:Tfp pilus assembly protein PilO